MAERSKRKAKKTENLLKKTDEESEGVEGLSGGEGRKKKQGR